MAIVGYGRVSTLDQDLEIQQEALTKAGCEKIFMEKSSGTTTKGRVKLEECLDYLREGDTLIITRVDRLGRSVGDLQDIVKNLKSLGVELKATEQAVDTSSPAGKAFFDMLGVFAEFETNLRKERQLEGITRAKAKGKYKGRKSILQKHRADVERLLNEGVQKTKIADELDISRSTVYKLVRLIQSEGAVS